jgi:hypothetical protein
MKEHRLELADIFRTHQKDFLNRWSRVLSRQQRKALHDIRHCRTAALGGHLQQCHRCGHRVILYNPGPHRHCPKCQAMAPARWLQQRQAELLPIPYFHVVFTLPQQIGQLALPNAKLIYTLLFRAASQTLLETAAEPRLLGASIEKAARIDWVVHVQPPFGGPERVLQYLARYTHRVAISNHRLRSLEPGRVTFE